MECKFWKSHTHVISDHRVTKGVTSPIAIASNASGWVGSTCHHPPPSPQERVGVQTFKLHPPGPASAPRPASTPLAPACWVDALHAASAPLTLRAGSAPRPCALCRCPRPLRTGSASPALRAVWPHPAPAPAPVLVLVPFR